MKYNLYAVYDSKAGMFLPPFPAGTDSVAVRNFADAVQNPQSPLNKHPEDYSLHRTGIVWDDTDCSVEKTKAENISHASNFASPGGAGR